MNSTYSHDEILCREILVVEPLKFKHGSREKGNAWKNIAINLNGNGSPEFSVDQKAVRDRETHRVIQKQIEENFSSLTNLLAENELIINCKKGKREVMMLGTNQRLDKVDNGTLHLYHNSTPNAATQTYKYLRLTLTTSLNMSHHLAATIKKVSSITHTKLHRCKDNLADMSGHYCPYSYFWVTDTLWFNSTPCQE